MRWLRRCEIFLGPSLCPHQGYSRNQKDHSWIQTWGQMIFDSMAQPAHPKLISAARTIFFQNNQVAIPWHRGHCPCAAQPTAFLSRRHRIEQNEQFDHQMSKKSVLPGVWACRFLLPAQYIAHARAPLTFHFVSPHGRALLYLKP